jgi:hypothetical protein
MKIAAPFLLATSFLQPHFSVASWPWSVSIPAIDLYLFATVAGAFIGVYKSNRFRLEFFVFFFCYWME